MITPFKERIAGRAAAFITAHPLPVMAVVLGLGLLFASHLPKLKLDGNMDSFDVANHPDTLFYRKVRDIFPKQEFFIVTFKDKDIFTPENLGFLKEISQKFAAIEDVTDVRSLGRVDDTRGTHEDFVVEPFFEEVPTTPEALQALRARAFADPLYVKNLISADGTTASIVIYVNERSPDPLFRPRVVAEVKELLKPYEAAGRVFHLAGWTYTDANLTQYMRRDLRVFVPITFGLVFLTIAFLFRRLRLLLLACFNIGLTVCATLGLTAWLGVPLNNDSVIVIPLVMALALSDTVHLFSQMRTGALRAAPTPRAALTRILTAILFPCLITSVNTGLGFLSNIVSPVPAISRFGWLAASGMVFEFLFSFGVLAPLLAMMNPEKVYREDQAVRESPVPRLLAVSQEFVERRPRLVLGMCLGLLAAVSVFLKDFRLETNLLHYFWPSDPIRISANFVEENMAGVESFDIVLSAREVDAFKDPETLAYMERLSEKVRALPKVDVANSLVDLVKKMNKSFHAENPRHYKLPDNKSLVAQYLLLYGGKDLDDYVNPSYTQTRLFFRSSERSSALQKHLLDQVKNELVNHPPPAGIEARVCGRMVNQVNSIKGMMDGQWGSLTLSIATIWFVMLMVLGSWRLSLLFLLPNLYPIVANFGFMGLLDIPLNEGTALIASSAFGIIVDDTVHFFIALKEKLKPGVEIREALRGVTETKGESMMSAFLTLLAAFGVLMLASFVPVVQFGILNVVVLLVGIIGDLFLLRSTLLSFSWKSLLEPRKKRPAPDGD